MRLLTHLWLRILMRKILGGGLGRRQNAKTETCLTLDGSCPEICRSGPDVA